MATHQTNDRDRIIVAKYLLEAHGKERQLETALQAQIALAERPGVERALSDHLLVTRDQITALEERLGEIGHTESSIPGLAAAEAVVGLVSTVANKGIALAKGPLQALRGTSPADNELRNVRDCYWNEAEEIAHYRVIETVAEQVGDTRTAELARKHRAEEEAMQRTLEGLLPGVVRDVVETDSPDASRDQRPTPATAAPTNGSPASGPPLATVMPTPKAAPTARVAPSAKAAPTAKAATTPKAKSTPQGKPTAKAQAAPASAAKPEPTANAKPAVRTAPAAKAKTPAVKTSPAAKAKPAAADTPAAKAKSSAKAKSTAKTKPTPKAKTAATGKPTAADFAEQATPVEADDRDEPLGLADLANVTLASETGETATAGAETK